VPAAGSRPTPASRCWHKLGVFLVERSLFERENDVGINPAGPRMQPMLLFLLKLAPAIAARTQESTALANPYVSRIGPDERPERRPQANLLIDGKSGRLLQPSAPTGTKTRTVLAQNQVLRPSVLNQKDLSVDRP
jgi:hypothetical protein